MAEQTTLGRAELGEGERLARLEAQVESLAREVGRLQDLNAIRVLQHTYGYFMDKGLYDEVVDLFAEDGQLRFMGGVFKGKAGVRRLYCGRLRPGFTGKNGPAFGLLCDHMQLQDAIHVAPDGLTARGRFRAVLIGGSHDLKPDKNPHLPRQWWEGGLYENQYVKQDGGWKVKVMGHHLTWQGEFETGWAHFPPYDKPFWSKTYPDDPLGPDEIVPDEGRFWPHTDLVPFHYPHPVTGKPIVAEE
jgi:carotenoid cleavage dioxygenase